MPQTLTTRIVITVLTCLVVGPPVGLLAFSLISAANRVELFWFGNVLNIALVTYLCGSAQAICVGFIYSVSGWYMRDVPLWLVVVAIIVVSVLASLAGFVFSRTGEVTWQLKTLPEFFWVHGTAALFCRLIVKRFWTDTRT
jgi:hypothetical protein